GPLRQPEFLRLGPRGDRRERKILFQDNKTRQGWRQGAAHRFPGALFRPDAPAADDDVLRERLRPGARSGEASRTSAGQKTFSSIIFIRSASPRRRRNAVLR